MIVIGPMGSGKSTLTRKISEKLKVPRLELDRLWFEAGGHVCLINDCTEEQKKLVKEYINKQTLNFLSTNEHWIVDGTHSKIKSLLAEKADVVVLIHRPILDRLFSHIVRVIRGENRHPETSFWQDLLHTRTILNKWLQGSHKTQIDAVMPYKDKLLILRSFKEVDNYFNSLK